MIRKKEVTRAELREEQLREEVKGQWGREKNTRPLRWLDDLTWVAILSLGGIFIGMMLLNLVTF